MESAMYIIIYWCYSLLLRLSWCNNKFKLLKHRVSCPCFSVNITWPNDGDNFKYYVWLSFLLLNEIIHSYPKYFFYYCKKDNGTGQSKYWNYITHYSFEQKLTSFPAKLDLSSFIGWTQCQETHHEIQLARVAPAVTRMNVGYIEGTIVGGVCSSNQQSLFGSEPLAFVLRRLTVSEF